MSERPRWKQLLNAKKPHLFVGGRSLCNKYMFLGTDYDGPWTGRVNDDDCKACVKAAQKSYPTESVK